MASYRLSAKAMKATYIRALRQGLIACWLVNFKDAGYTLEIRLLPNGTELMTDGDAGEA